MGFNIPHGPCIIFFIITSCNSGSSILSGISADMTLSISFGLILSNFLAPNQIAIKQKKQYDSYTKLL
jgi:hypothetical protein